MRKLISGLVVAAVSTFLLVVSPSAIAATNGDLAGTWNAASLRQNNIGYSLVLKKGAKANTYAGTLRMRFEDGTKGPKIPVAVTKKGNTVTLVLPGKKTLTGTIGQDGSINFAKCQKKLAYVTTATAGAMCMFQEMPA